MVVGMIVAPELAPLWGALSGYISGLLQHNLHRQ
jgi:hypothetical protein